MSRKPLMAGNWKMQNTIGEALALVRKLNVSVGKVRDREILVCPPFTALKEVSHILNDSEIQMGAQNMHFEEKGAFTGDISPDMLRDVGATYVILGHSERRELFLENDSLIAKKVVSAISHALKPILCVGEQLADREAGNTDAVVLGQLNGSLEGVTKQMIDDLVIAYEPVWAIGTGVTASPEQAQDIHLVIRQELINKFGPDGEKTRILYGGSVKPDNVDELMAKQDIDGALVGGASLKSDSFSRIVRFET